MGRLLKLTPTELNKSWQNFKNIILLLDSKGSWIISEMTMMLNEQCEGHIYLCSDNAEAFGGEQTQLCQ